MLTTSAISRYSDAGHPSNGQRISLRIHLHAVCYSTPTTKAARTGHAMRLVTYWLQSPGGSSWEGRFMRIQGAFVAGAVCRSLPAVTPNADVSYCRYVGPCRAQGQTICYGRLPLEETARLLRLHRRAYITLSPSLVYLFRASTGLRTRAWTSCRRSVSL